MRIRSIRTRLTLWYFSVLAAALTVFAAGMWIAMNRSLYHSVDDSLRDRVRGIARFIEEQGDSLSLEEARGEFREHSVLGPGGDLFQVADAQGNWLYRSDPLYDEHMPIYGSKELGSERRFENIEIKKTSLRLLSQNFSVGGQTYTAQVAAPLDELREGLDALLWVMLPAIPILLGLATLGGYGLSRRALAPVDEISRTARLISARNLSQRLAVPQTGDELQRLSETLNDMMQRLESSFKRVTQFTADASHELRTPVALMRTIAELTLRKNRSESEYREALEQIYMELERTSQLVENLMVLARADSSWGGPAAEPMDLAESVRDACLEGKTLARVKKVTFRYELPEDGITMRGDAQAIRRLFLILIDNAVKYTATGGEVTVSLETTDGDAWGRVKDTGIGIPREDLPNIFERFYRADKARSRDTGGAGLGLSIARWIADVHAGEIEVESEPGKGSVFSVRLPIQR